MGHVSASGRTNHISFKYSNGQRRDKRGSEEDRGVGEEHQIFQIEVRADGRHNTWERGFARRSHPGISVFENLVSFLIIFYDKSLVTSN